MEAHRVQFGKWCSNDAQNAGLLRLVGVVSQAAAKMKARSGGAQGSHDQPNPWGKDGIVVSSKRCLAHVMSVYNGTSAKYGVDVEPLTNVVLVCMRIAAPFCAEVELVPGPPKTEERVMEKASQGDGNYATIRDLGQLSLVVADIELVPNVVDALVECNDFAVGRIKTRLERGLEADL